MFAYIELNCYEKARHGMNPPSFRRTKKHFIFSTQFQIFPHLVIVVFSQHKQLLYLCRSDFLFQKIEFSYF